MGLSLQSLVFLDAEVSSKMVILFVMTSSPLALHLPLYTQQETTVVSRLKMLRGLGGAVHTSHLSLGSPTRCPSRGQGLSGDAASPGNPRDGDREGTAAQRLSNALEATTRAEMLLLACKPIHRRKDTIAGAEGRPRCPRRTCSRAPARVRSMVGASRRNCCATARATLNSSQGPAS